MGGLLSEAARKEALAGLGGWGEAGGGQSLDRTLTVRDVNQALGLLAPPAPVAEKSDHHPDWRNVYKTVEVSLSTHDAGGVTARDVALAKAMNEIATKLGV